MDHHQNEGHNKCCKSGHGHHRVDGKDEDKYGYKMVSRTTGTGHVTGDENGGGQGENNEKGEGKGKRVLLEDGKLADQKHNDKNSQGDKGNRHL